MLADVLRTEGHRLHPPLPDSAATVALRASVRARTDLVRTRVRLVRQLSVHLVQVFPGALGLFAQLDSRIAGAFPARFPSGGHAAWLSPQCFDSWLAKQSDPGRHDGTELHARLVAAPAGVNGPEAEPLAAVTLGYVLAIGALREQVAFLEDRLAVQLAAHPDGAVFTSLPGTGTMPGSGVTQRDG